MSSLKIKLMTEWPHRLVLAQNQQGYEALIKELPFFEQELLHALAYLSHLEFKGESTGRHKVTFSFEGAETDGILKSVEYYMSIETLAHDPIVLVTLEKETSALDTDTHMEQVFSGSWSSLIEFIREALDETNTSGNSLLEHNLRKYLESKK